MSTAWFCPNDPAVLVYGGSITLECVSVPLEEKPTSSCSVCGASADLFLEIEIGEP